jgi:hypothetical protein
MATWAFCGKPAEKEVGKKGACKVCAGEITKKCSLMDSRASRQKRRNKAAEQPFFKRPAGEIQERRIWAQPLKLGGTITNPTYNNHF